MKTDSALQTEILRELAADPSITHEHIGVSVQNGIATLNGIVPTFTEKFAAEKAAQRVSDVRAVVEKIEVQLTPQHERGDQDIAEAVAHQFKWNIQVPHQMIKTRVEDGWVILTGSVDWEFQRKAAEKCIQGFVGIKGIVNNLTIRTKPVDPLQIRRKIEAALRREAKNEAQNICIHIDGGIVKLSGTVRSFADLEDAKWAAWSAPGVEKVETELFVAPSPDYN